MLRNISLGFGSGELEAKDLIITEEVLATAAVNYYGAHRALAIGASTTPRTPTIGAVSPDPVEFYSNKSDHAINYRVSDAEEGLQMLNVAVNSKLRCQSFGLF